MSRSIWGGSPNFPGRILTDRNESSELSTTSKESFMQLASMYTYKRQDHELK
jgi:hypothetical protein